MKRRTWRRRVLRLAVLGAILVALYLGRAPILSGAARWLDVSQAPVRVDYVLVLAGDVDTRPFAAAELHRAKLTPRILMAELLPMPLVAQGLMPPEHELTARILQARGVPAEAFEVLPGACESTRDEARRLAAFLADKPDAQVAVLTTGYHTRRARWLFQRELGDRMANVVFLGVPTDGFSPDNWWRFELGWVTYLNEYLKFAYHALRW